MLERVGEYSEVCVIIVVVSHSTQIWYGFLAWMEEMETGEVQVHNTREWHNQNTQEDFFESKAQLPMHIFS